MCIFIFIRSKICSLFTDNLSLIFLSLHLPSCYLFFVFPICSFSVSFIVFFLINHLKNFHSIFPFISLLVIIFSLLLVLTTWILDLLVPKLVGCFSEMWVMKTLKFFFPFFSLIGIIANYFNYIHILNPTVHYITSIVL